MTRQSTASVTTPMTMYVQYMHNMVSKLSCMVVDVRFELQAGCFEGYPVYATATKEDYSHPSCREYWQC